MDSPRVKPRPAITALCVALWAIAFVAHLDQLVSDRLTWVTVRVTPVPDGPPRVASLWAGAPAERVADESPRALRRGDEVLSIGTTSLIGASRLSFLGAAYAGLEHGPEGPFVLARARRNGEVFDARIPIEPVSAPWRLPPLVASLVATTLFLSQRRAESRAGHAAGWACLAYAATWTLFLSVGGTGTRIGFVWMVGFASLFIPLTLRAIQKFPDAGSPAAMPRPEPLWPWIFAVEGPLVASWLIGSPLPGEFGSRALMVVHVLAALTLLVSIVLRYVAVGAVARRQLRGVVLGCYLGLAPVAVAATFASVTPAAVPIYEWSHAATIAIPIALIFALGRAQLFDVDRLISQSAVYSLFGIVFLGVAISLVPFAAEAASAGLGIRPTLSVPIVALAFAFGLMRIERSVRPGVERRLFPERAAFEDGVQALRSSLGETRGADDMLEKLTTGLGRLLDVETCVAYARSGDAFVPSATSGAAIPPAFAAEGSLVALLEDAEAPVDLERQSRWIRRGRISALEVASLASLDPHVLLPIRRGDELLAFLCLGEKGSGDLYTPVDLALLDGLRDRVSVGLEALDADALASAERARRERVERYVPAAVRETPDPADVAPGEREVTVLFVDIRGYTGIAEGRDADEIFAIVNAYTTEVSRIMREHGGWVVEFQGDGLMIVFGAPAALDGKERAAVDAAMATLERFRGELPGLNELPLELGIGIATGPAFVGNVQSIDREIWCVIGNTTNLAARLQSKTGEWSVGIALDEPTAQRAGSAISHFEVREGVALKGRSEAFRVFAGPRR